MPTTTETETPSAEASYWQRLLHRWLVQYNPLYLVSAMLVLAGMVLSSRGLAHDGRLLAQLGVAAVAELYAAALIGGAALLTRIGQRRPAVMLALLTVLYQCDLTLHTETSAYMGDVIGVAASFAWWTSFVAKLFALAWAMKLRLSRAAIAMATIGASGLALFPHLLPGLSPRVASGLVAAWLFALAAIHRPGLVTSAVELDTWGDTVLRRAVRAAWILSGVLLVLHVAFWSTEKPISLATLLPIAPLLAARRARRETRAFGVVAVTLLVAFLALPAAFSVTSLLAAVALALRAFGTSSDAAPRPAPPLAATEQPYRTPRFEAAPVAPPPLTPESVSHAERVRLMTGSIFALYLSLWSTGWSEGASAHVVVLDVALAAVLLLVAWRGRARFPLVPPAATFVHLVLDERLVPTPRSLVEWGGAAVGLGFVMLFGSLAASYRLSRGPLAGAPGGPTAATCLGASPPPQGSQAQR